MVWTHTWALHLQVPPLAFDCWLPLKSNSLNFFWKEYNIFFQDSAISVETGLKILELLGTQGKFIQNLSFLSDNKKMLLTSSNCTFPIFVMIKWDMWNSEQNRYAVNRIWVFKEIVVWQCCSFNFAVDTIHKNPWFCKS